MFAGVIPILATPFHEDEGLDLHSWQRLLEFMLALGVDGVTILGVLGESNRLNDRGALIADRKRGDCLSSKRVPIIVGASAAGTRDRPVSLRGWHKDLGADAVMVAPSERSRCPTRTASLSCISRSVESISRFRSCCRITPRRPTCTCRAGLIVRIVRAVPSIALREGGSGADLPKIRQVREGAAVNGR